MRFGSTTLGAGAAGALLLFAAHAQATTFDFVSSGSCSEACSASAAITPGNGILTIVLSDTQANPRSAGDLVSSIEVTPSTGVGTPTLSSQAGNLITVTSNTGPYMVTSGPPTHWGVGTSSGQIVLETAGPFAQPGAPINMIIGPTDSSGNYSNGNASVVDGHFSPYIDGSGTFVIADSAITSATLISAVTFNFGTGPDTFLPGVPTHIPEPASMLLLGTGLLGLGLMKRRHIEA